MSQVSWTDDRVEQLKKLWESGLSCSQVAAELGGVTRNAVIGKVHRLGLAARPMRTPSATPRPRKARPVQFRARGNENLKSRPSPKTALAHAFEIDLNPDAIAEFDFAIPVAQRVSLLELTAETCHWPIGDPQAPDFSFCGDRPLKDRPYCAHHTRVAHQPSYSSPRLSDEERAKRAQRARNMARARVPHEHQ